MCVSTMIVNKHYDANILMSLMNFRDNYKNIKNYNFG